MRTTVAIEDKLMDTLRLYTGEKENGAVIRAALQGYVQKEAARRLARLGGTAPDLKSIPRRRLPPA